MVGSAISHRWQAYAFALTALTIYTISVWIMLGIERFAQPGPLLVGAILDLVLTVPLAYYVFVVRRHAVDKLTIVPIVIVGAVVARVLIPIEHASTLRLLEFILIPLELGLLAFVATRAHRSVKKLRSEGALADAVEGFRNAAQEVSGGSRVADIIATELALLYYGLFSWRSLPHIPDGVEAFSAHKKTGNGSIVLGAALLIVVEIIPLHLLVGQWSAWVAWLLSIASVYALLLLVGDYRATILRPILFDGKILSLRSGLRWNVDVSVARISRIEKQSRVASKSSLDITLVGSATHWLVLTEPATVRGIYGITRTVGAIGIQPDDPVRFESLVADSLA